MAIRGHRCDDVSFPVVNGVIQYYRGHNDPIDIPRLSFCTSYCYSNRGLELFKDVLAKGRECEAGKTGSEVVSCYVKASPSKCESYIYEVYSRRNNAARQAWRLCVATCADAGLWSRTYGECARDLD